MCPWILDAVLGSGMNLQTIPELRHIPARLVSVGAVTPAFSGRNTCKDRGLSVVAAQEGRAL